MKKVYLISCTANKQKYKCKAEEMYSKSNLFRLSLLYALNRVDDKDSQIFILSANYGLLPLSEVIEPYDMTLKRMNKSEIITWGKKVYKQMKEKFDLKNTKFIFLSGQSYIKPLEQYLNKENIENPIPVNKRMIGKRMKWLKENSDKDEKSFS